MDVGAPHFRGQKDELEHNEGECKYAEQICKSAGKQNSGKEE